MGTFTVEFKMPSVPPLKQREVEAYDYTVKGDFVEFIGTDDTKVFSVRADAVVTITRHS
ncbi:hypothetical protein [Streptomyces sp. NPDC093089]|uniref:hypothetical protein n=1 Tax=Streptomyces sp. NPDC093089 TaxID=3366024 RepID=UPI003805149B